MDMCEIDFPSPLSKSTHHQEEYTYALHEYPRNLDQGCQMSMHSVVPDTAFSFSQSAQQDPQLSSHFIATPPITIAEDGNHVCSQYVSPSNLSLPHFRSSLQEPLYHRSDYSITLDGSVIAMQAMHHSPDQLFYGSPLSVDMSPVLESNQDELQMMYSNSPDEHLLSLIIPHESSAGMSIKQQSVPMQTQAQCLVDSYPVQEPLLPVQSDHPNILVNSNTSMQGDQQTIQLQMDSRQIQQQIPHRLHHNLHHSHNNHHQNYHLHEQIFHDKQIQGHSMFNTMLFQPSDHTKSPRHTPESHQNQHQHHHSNHNNNNHNQHHQQHNQSMSQQMAATNNHTREVALVSRQDSLVTSNDQKVKNEDRQTDRKPLDAVIAGVTQHQKSPSHLSPMHSMLGMEANNQGDDSPLPARPGVPLQAQLRSPPFQPLVPEMPMSSEDTQHNMKRGLPADAQDGMRNKVRRKAAKTSPQRSPVTNKGHGPDSGNKSQHGNLATHDSLHKASSAETIDSVAPVFSDSPKSNPTDAIMAQMPFESLAMNQQLVAASQASVVAKEFDGMSREQLIARLIDLETEKRAGTFHGGSTPETGYRQDPLVSGHTEEGSLSNHRSDKSASPREVPDTEREIKREDSIPENTAEDPYKCQWTDCGQVFSVMQDFILHISDTHVGSGKPTYVCEWSGCPRSQKPFTKRHKMHNHLRTHTGERPFECQMPDCNKKFSRLDSLTTHIKTHSDIKPFECPYHDCGKTYYHTRSLRKHEKNHRPERSQPEMCMPTTYTFPSSGQITHLVDPLSPMSSIQQTSMYCQDPQPHSFQPPASSNPHQSHYSNSPKKWQTNWH